jgi:uncharacterized protein YgbK (DUF1537 family)
MSKTKKQEQNDAAVAHSIAPMTQQQVNEYMQHILSEKSDLPDMEMHILQQFKATSSKVEQLAKQFKQLQQQLQATDNEIKRGYGQLDAYADLLVSAENSRRANDGKQ